VPVVVVLNLSDRREHYLGCDYVHGGRILIAIDLSHVEEEGEIDIYPTTLPFVQTVMTVGGFSLDYACEGHHDDQDNGHGTHSGAAAEAGRGTVWRSLTVNVVVFFFSAAAATAA
jgi:hypothetical protein